jgi:hypothetical protein
VRGIVRNFYGAIHGEFSTPRNALSVDERIAYATTMPDGGNGGGSGVCGWDLGSERLLTTLRTHNGGSTLKAMRHHPSAPRLLTAGFDKIVSVWEAN